MRARSLHCFIAIIATCPILVTGGRLVLVRKMDVARRVDQWLQALFGHSANLKHSLQNGKG